MSAGLCGDPTPADTDVAKMFYVQKRKKLRFVN